jgi:hypothetical protein
VEQNILLAITSSKIKLYTYMQPDNPNCFDEKKFNITIYPLNNLELKEAYFVLITTPVK